MKHYCFVMIVLGILFFDKGFAQKHRTLDLLFYNVENYFDIQDDPDRNDNEFTPEGTYKWTYNRFISKRNNIYRAIVGIDANKVPDIIGLCEIENKYVLNQLVHETPLSHFNYKIAHRDSPDPRGIDVALLYRPKRFELIKLTFYSMQIDRNKNRSREILYAKGLVDKKDTLHLLVNHWPSKRGGQTKSEPKRMLAAKALKQITDSILKSQPNAAICIMGDFNDYVDSRAITESLGALHNFERIQPKSLYNLAYPLSKKGIGSIKYKNRWELIDMFFVSGSLLNPKSRLNCDYKDMRVFDNSFLLESKSGKGYQPKRTYIGQKYHGGFSDHLPIGLKLKIRK